MAISDRKGFTLIELVVVVVIIGILSVIAVPIMDGVKAKAISTEAMTGLSALVTAVKQYKAEYGVYPPPNPSCWVKSAYPHSYFPSISFRDSGTPATLDGKYFSEESYQYAGSQSSPGVVLYVNAYGNYTFNLATGAREAAGTTDSPPNASLYTKGTTSQYPSLFFNIVENRFRQWGWSKTGLPEN